MRIRRALIVVLGLLALAGVPLARADLGTVGPDSPVCKVRQTPPSVGLTQISATPLDTRLTTYTFFSQALSQTVHANVLLPVGYSPTRAYSVLYLLHGHGGGYGDWASTAHGDVESIVTNQRVIVVMPDGGYDGWYSDWYGSDLDGHTPYPPPAWETFHIRELIPWVDATFSTIGNRGGRAIAGLSMGGFGATSYAARHPDMFGAAGSFSGAVDMDLDYPVGNIGEGVVSNLPDGRVPDMCVWGDPATQDVVWRDHDPTELAGNLRGVWLYLASGTGVPGAQDAPNPAASLTEQGIWQMNQVFAEALTVHGVGHYDNFYSQGIHAWPYWRDDLRDFLTRLTFIPRPATFDYRTIATDFSVFRWHFRTDRTVKEFTYLEGVGPASGFRAGGSGTLTATSPPRTFARGRYLITTPFGTTSASAGGNGSMTFSIDLGPAHPVQQYAFGQLGEATLPVVDVTIAPAS